jgi:hypothetical protein
MPIVQDLLEPQIIIINKIYVQGPRGTKFGTEIVVKLDNIRWLLVHVANVTTTYCLCPEYWECTTMFYELLRHGMCCTSVMEHW